jgi:hypothetical protein
MIIKEIDTYHQSPHFQAVASKDCQQCVWIAGCEHVQLYKNTMPEEETGAKGLKYN